MNKNWLKQLMSELANDNYTLPKQAYGQLRSNGMSRPKAAWKSRPAALNPWGSVKDLKTMSKGRGLAAALKTPGGAATAINSAIAPLALAGILAGILGHHSKQDRQTYGY